MMKKTLKPRGIPMGNIKIQNTHAFEHASEV